MKKILYILFCLIPLLAMQSCTENLVENELTLDGKISTTISVTVPQLPDAHPQTRAMAVQPLMTNLYLAVFDENGYLLEYVKADNTTQMAIENGTTYTYKVSLKPTESTTYIHFIGNAPKTNLDFGSESEVLKNLYTENGSEAYWQRVTLSNGIKNDDATITALSGVKLIRNFAWINVISSDTKFVINSYCIVNTRTAGSVAPYNTNKNEFVTFSDNKTYDNITANGTNQDNYNGFIPSVARINSDIPTENSWFNTSSQSSSENYAYFVYEREKALSNPPFILLKATYNGTGNRYYKVDLRDSEGNYFPIVRNFKYRINITSVGHSGYDSAEAAANGAGSGDVSSAIETQSFNNISNGDERLFVSYTDTTLVEKSNNVKLRYKYIVFETADNGTVTEVNKTSTATVTTTGTVIPDGYNVNNNITAGSGEWNGWNEITFSTTDIASANKTQTFVITGTNNRKTLQRTVNITLRKKYTMDIECNPDEIPTDMGKPFDVIVNVPGGLGRSMFPLEIQLEAGNQSMTPNLGDNLPTVTGPSIVPGKNKTTIGFIKQVSWADYEEFFEANTGTSDMPVTCHFKSNKSNAAGTTTTIYASNKYFNQASDNLGYFDANQFTDLNFTPATLPATLNQPINFTFKMSALPSSVTGSDGKVTVALCNLKLSDSDTNGLTHISSDAAKGIAYYTFTPTNTSVSLNLQNTDVNVEAKVMLSSYHFEDAEKSMNYTKGTFTNLSLTNFNRYLTQNSVGTFTFKLSSQIKQGRYVTVTLGNLVPADNETRLTVIDEKAGTYRFDPTGIAANTNITLQLKVKTSFQTVSAKLSADYFEDNSVTLNPQRGSFSGLELTAGNPTLPVSEPVTLNFTMDDMPSGDVSITLTNLEPEGATRATFENGVYTFSPQNLTESLTFKVVNAGQQVAAKLSAEYFDDATVSLEPWTDKTIKQGVLNVGNSYMDNKKEYTFTLYTINPGTSNNNPGNNFYEFTSQRNGGNPEFTIGYEVYNAIMSTDKVIYVRFKGNDSRYHVATANLQTLLNGGTVALKWSK